MNDKTENKNVEEDNEIEESNEVDIAKTRHFHIIGMLMAALLLIAMLSVAEAFQGYSTNKKLNEISTMVYQLNEKNIENYR